MATPYNRYNSTATGVANDVSSSIAGKVVLTTGVSQGGLGAFFVETIAQHGPSLLILAGRSLSKIQATADKITSINTNVKVRTLVLDLASQTQVREAAKEVLAYPEAIDVLVNSAGIMAGPWATTKEGIELQFGSNHIGHFLFTNLIMSKILASGKSPRIVNVSSNGHELGAVRFDDHNFQDGKVYEQWEAYGQSKAANILFSKALAEKLGPKGLKAYSLHPGVAMGTSLAPGLSEEDFGAGKALNQKLGDPLGVEANGGEFDVKTVDECAATHVVAAFDTRIDEYNGAYLVDGHLEKEGVTASSPADVEKLWKLSEKLVGQEFQY